MNNIVSHRDETTQGYWTFPKSQKGRGVLVCHAWWGLNSFFQQLCQRLAEVGFVTFAPDLYGGKVASTIEEAKALRQGLDRSAVNKQLKAAVQHLVTNEHVTGDKIGVLGCSLGAHYAYWISDNCPKDVAAVVAFYGVGAGNFSRTQAVYLGHYAETDDWGANSKKVNKLKDKLINQGREVTFYTYPDTTHWFFESDVTRAYNADAAKLAWERSIEFLNEKLA